MNNRECIFCGSKTIAFYVSSEDKYICPKHYYVAKQNLGEESIRNFYKNKIVVKDNIGYMTIYNNKYEEKEVAMIDVEDIELIKDLRWHIATDGHVVTYIAPKKIRKSKKTGLVVKNRLRLCDYIMYLRSGIICPVYHTNNNLLDCRKLNLRKCRDKMKELSSIRYIKTRGSGIVVR